MRRRFIGWAARTVGAVPVGRALDMSKAASGKIYLPDPIDDPTRLRGIGTRFDTFQVGGLIVLPSVAGVVANAEIAEIIGPEELRLKRPFQGDAAVKLLTGRDMGDDGQLKSFDSATETEYAGTTFKAAPKVDQTEVYDAVFEKLMTGGCVGIFPEGGSHDRSDLLPLKRECRDSFIKFHPYVSTLSCPTTTHVSPRYDTLVVAARSCNTNSSAGVAIMALGALAANPKCGVRIVPCGMNYFHPHKFRSRAVIEFGQPVEVPAALVELYKSGQRREAIGQLLETVYQSLVAVTVTSPDYDTLMVGALS